MTNNFRLIGQECTREGFEKYVDLYLVWQHESKVYSIRVRPQFGREYKVLVAAAQMIPSGEPLEKYL